MSKREEISQAATTRPSQRLNGKSIIVTGAASGIGRGIALRAYNEGARVALLDRNGPLLDTVVEELNGLSDKVMVAECDLIDAKKAANTIAQVTSRLDGLDGIVCSAGITKRSNALDCSLGDWNEIIAINLTGTFACAQAAAQLMYDAGRKGSIVTISSTLALTGQPSGIAYAASKAGVIAATKSMAIDLGKAGIRCNSIAPGIVDTPLARGAMTAEYVAASGERTALRRVAQPDDIAPAACFLLSDEAGWITGQTIHVNGGSYMA